MKTTKGKTQENRNSKKPSNNEGMDNDLHELFIDELADILNAEQQLIKALPKMAEAAQATELREAFQSHLEETRQHAARLEQVFKSLDESVKSKTCKAMKGLLEEGAELMEELEDSSALDAGLIAAAQKVEHYEIASYGTVCAWAEQMGHDEALELLEKTLDEEKTADEKLTEIAMSVANQEGEEKSSD